MESELADERCGPRGDAPARPSPAWEALWPPRGGSVPELQGGPAPRSAEPSAPSSRALQSTTNGREARELEARLELKIADLSNVLEGWQAELVQRTQSEIEGLRASMENTLAQRLASTESRSAAHVDRLEKSLAAVAGSQREPVAALTLSVEDAIARQGEVERELREETRALGAAIEELRSDVNAATAAGAQLVQDAEAGINARVRTVTGELARLRRQLTSTEARFDQRLAPLVQRLSETGAIAEDLMSSTHADAAEVKALLDEFRADLVRLSKSMEVHRAHTASRADLAALEGELEDRVVRELASTRSQLDAKLVTLDAVVDAVDAAAAALETGLVERVTGVASVAATSALAPVRSDLRSVHAEVAAAQRSIRELRRQVRTALPPPAPASPTHGVPRV